MSFGSFGIGSRAVRCLARRRQRCFSSSAVAAASKPPLCIVDLRGSGWSLLERLFVEEFLYETTKSEQSWLVVGTHEATEHRKLKLTEKAPDYIEDSVLAMDDYNPSCAIVVDPNKNKEDLNVLLIERDGVLCLEGRPFVGESVVLDHTSLLTTLLLASEQDGGEATADLMTEQLWKPTFAQLEEQRLESGSSTKSASPLTMVLDTKSCSKGDNSGRLITFEDLGITREDEAVKEETTTASSSSTPLPLTFQKPNNLLLGDFSIGRIHADEATNSVRSVFWWDYEDDHFSNYLASNNDRIWKLQDAYQQQQAKLVEFLQAACRQHYEVTEMNPREIGRLMAQEKTDLQEWWDTNRSKWKIVQQF